MKKPKSNSGQKQENGGEAKSTQQPRSWHRSPITSRDILCVFQADELFRQRPIAQFLSVQINQVNSNVVFHLPFAQIMDKRPPMRVLLEIFGDTLREQDVSAVAAIHDQLGHVDPGTGYIRVLIHVNDAA